MKQKKLNQFAYLCSIHTDQFHSKDHVMKKLSVIVFSLVTWGLTSCHFKASRASGFNDSIAARRDSMSEEAIETDTAIGVKKDTLNDKGRHYSRQEVENAMRIMERKMLKGTPANRVISGFDLQGNVIMVSLIFDSPENRTLVRKHLTGAPFVSFEGVKVPRPINHGGIEDTLNICLIAGQTVYPHDVRMVSTRLYNGSRDTILIGEETDLAFLDAHGVWRALPMRRAWTDIGICLAPGQTHISKTKLSPEAFPTPSGRYRYYFPVYIDGQKVWLMTAFRIE